MPNLPGSLREPTPTTARFSRWRCFAACVAGLTISLLGASAYAADRVTLPTRTPAQSTPWAPVADAGAVPGSQELTLTVLLAVPATRSANLAQRLADQLDPTSPQFRQWLTPQQFAASFGATDDEIAAATAWLEAQSLTVTGVAAAHTTLTVTGTAAQVEAAFAVSLRQVQVAGSVYFGNSTQPSLPSAAAGLIAGLSGLDTMPPSIEVAASNTTTADVPGAIASALDANTSPVLSLTSTACAGDMAQADAAIYTALFQQANAQGITVLATSACTNGTGSFPSSLAEVTAVASPGASAPTSPIFYDARPAWQSAPGLPPDTNRHEPDLTAAQMAAFTQTISSLVQQAGSRLGNINRTLYQLGPIPDLYAQPDSPPAGTAAAGTWEPATGLGLVDLATLVKVFPRGAGASYTAIAASNYAPVHGASTTLTATVTSGTGGATPTGTVTFATSTGTTLSTATLSGGVATYSTSTLPGGTTTITATYSGDTTYAGSVSPSTSIYVQAEASVLNATVSTGNIVGGTYTVYVTDTAPSGVGQPTGTITVTLSGTTTSYTGTLAALSAGSAAITVTIPASIVGTSTLSINCSGTANYSCNNPYTTTVTVGKATPTLVFTYSPKPPVSGASITFTGSLAAVGTAAVPTGNVTFYDNGTIINAGALSSGAVTASGTDITAATHTITATYAGDANYLTVTSSAAGSATTTTALIASSAIANGTSITFTATVTPSAVVGSTAPTGSVQFLDGTTLLATQPLASNTATYATSSLATTATHSITAVYSGDTNYGASTSPAVPIAKASGTSTSTSLSPTSTIANGTNITFSATVTPSSVVNSTAPTGSVQFLDGTTPLGTQTLASGAAAYSTSTLATTTTHSITAVYSGDTNYAGSTSPAVAITKASGSVASTTTVTPSSSTFSYGANVSYTATVTSGSTGSTTVPTGTVTFTYGSTQLCSIALASGSATCTPIYAVPVGTDVVTAAYSGDSTYAASSGTASVTVSSSTVVGTVAAAIAPASAPYNTYAVVTATVTLTSGTTIPSGSTVTATISGLSGTYTGTVTPSTGIASINVPVPPPGTYTVTVACVATTGFSCSNTATAALTATKSASLTTLGVSPTSAVAGQTLTLTAAVTASPGATPLTVTPTGTVTFSNNGTAIGSANINSSGVATFTVVLGAASANSYSATYAGDTNYLTSTSTAQAYTPTKLAPTITFFSNGNSTLFGLNVIFTVQVTNYASTAGTVPVPTGVVTFYDTSTGIPLYLGTANLTSNGVATGIAVFSTTGLSAGNHSIYAVYGGDIDYLPETSGTISILVSDFNLVFNPGTVQVSRGASAQTTATVNIVGGFSGTLALACTPPGDSQATCSFSPAVLTGAGQTVLTITTTAPSLKNPSGPQARTTPLTPRHAAEQAALRLSAGSMLGMLFWIAIPRRRRRLSAIVLLALAFFATGVTANLGCGNTVSTAPATISSGGSPLGTDIFTITASGQETLGTDRHNYPLQVTITQ
jgi:hypothetical protein